MQNIQIFKEEQIELEQRLNAIDEKITEFEKLLDMHQHNIIGFTEGLRGTQFNRQAMMSMYATNINELKQIRNSPYFGKFVFKNAETNEKQDIYIGKKIIVDQNLKLLLKLYRIIQNMRMEFVFYRDIYQRD